MSMLWNDENEARAKTPRVRKGCGWRVLLATIFLAGVALGYVVVRLVHGA